MSFQDGDQIGEFSRILESNDPDSYLIQEARPNTAEGKVIQYVGVARTDVKRNRPGGADAQRGF